MKLSSFTIIWIGIAIGLSALLFAFLEFWQPNQAEAEGFRVQKEALAKEIGKRPTLYKNRDNADKVAEEIAQRWRDIVSSKTPPPGLAAGGIDLDIDPYNLTVQSRKFRDNIQRAVNAQLRRGGVKILGTGPNIPMTDDAPASLLANFYNYPAIAFPVLIFDLGTVRVQGTWSQIMAHIHAYRSMPNYMAVVHGLDIQGTSPLLTASYQLTIVGYIRQAAVHPTAPDASEGGTGDGGGGGGGQGTAPQGGAPGAPGRAKPSFSGASL